MNNKRKMGHLLSTERPFYSCSTHLLCWRQVQMNLFFVCENECEYLCSLCRLSWASILAYLLFKGMPIVGTKSYMLSNQGRVAKGRLKLKGRVHGPAGIEWHINNGPFLLPNSGKQRKATNSSILAVPGQR